MSPPMDGASSLAAMRARGGAAARRRGGGAGSPSLAFSLALLPVASPLPGLDATASRLGPVFGSGMSGGGPADPICLVAPCGGTNFGNGSGAGIETLVLLAAVLLAAGPAVLRSSLDKPAAGNGLLPRPAGGVGAGSVARCPSSESDRRCAVSRRVLPS